MEDLELKWKILIATVALAFGLLVAWVCWKIATRVPDEDRVERHLGDGAVCQYLSGNHELRCTRGGVLYTCVIHRERVGCGVTAPSVLEAP